MWDKLQDIGMVLVRSGLAAVQLTIFAFLSWLYAATVAVVGLINIVYRLIMGEPLGSKETLLEPAMWALHQTAVLVAYSDDFRVAPYID